MKKLFLKRIVLPGFLFSTVGLPLAIAASCGSSDSKPVDTPKPKLELVNAAKVKALKAGDDSLHTNIKWPDVTTFTDPSVAKYEFYEGVPKTLEEIKKLPSDSWHESLPIETLKTFDQRALWVKITPNTGYTIEIPFIDLTTSSAITSVKVNVDGLAEYATVNLTKVDLSGTLDNPLINEVPAGLPEGTKLVYSASIAALGTEVKTFETKTDLENFIKNNAALFPIPINNRWKRV